MNILEYDAVDPEEVLHLNLMSLGYTLTPERARLIRRLDPRPFPFFALYATMDGAVVGQVAVYRLPVVTAEGPAEVGAVSAVCTHPAYSRRGVATRLMAEAHQSMRAAGLAFSTLGTSRHRLAYRLYRQLGYEDVHSSALTLAHRERLRSSTSLRAEPAGADRLALTDAIFQQVAAGRLGFARRPPGFLATLVAGGDVSVEEVWLLWRAEAVVGYALTHVTGAVLTIRAVLVLDGHDPGDAVAALLPYTAAEYVQVQVDGPGEATSLMRIGFPPAQTDWGTFMIKPLTPELTLDDARRMLAVDTERFLFSMLDVT